MSLRKDPGLNPTQTVTVANDSQTPKKYYHTKREDCHNHPSRSREVTVLKAERLDLTECPVCESLRRDGTHPNAGNTGQSDIEECAICGESIRNYPAHLPCEEDS